MASFLKRINEKQDVETHDLGFMYSPSCVAGYKLTGSRVGREAALKAAEELITRFHEKGQFIQAWGPLDAPDNYRLIIDCLLICRFFTGLLRKREIPDIRRLRSVTSIRPFPM